MTFENLETWIPTLGRASIPSPVKRDLNGKLWRSVLDATGQGSLINDDFPA
jgi:hypothetical protein